MQLPTKSSTTPDAVKALIAAARKSGGDFAPVLQRGRDEREEAAQIAAVAAELATANVVVIERPDYNDRNTKSLHELIDDKGKHISPEAHAACPGHVAWIARDWNGTRVVYGCSQWGSVGHATATAAPAAEPQCRRDERHRA